MAQNDVRASESTSQAVGQGEHVIESAVGGAAEVLASVGAGQRAAIEAVRGFVETVDPTLPVGGEEASARRSVIDAGVEMADRLVQGQYGFLRSLVHTAGSVVSPPGDASGEAGGD
ncbi:MAG TPA: hypothetical protein VLW51_01315 [Solirubrobacteraceae bacterium]|jgi:hypothetical protein|nr:hypothetical protein [Solirubrobacteraceae bacterium]